MKNLYYVCGLDWGNNVWIRYVVTASDYEKAVAKVLECEPKLRRVTASFICVTNDTVCQEL